MRRRSRRCPCSATIFARFLSRTVTLTISLPAIRFCRLDDLPVAAAPTGRLFRRTILERFFSGTVALDTSCTGLRRCCLHDFAVDAAPQSSSMRRRRWRWRLSTASFARFLFGAESLTASRAALCFSRLHDLSIEAAPPERRRSQRRAGRYINWRRSALRTSTTTYRLRWRTIRIAPICDRENQIQTR